MNIKTIILPVDDSGYSRKAAEHAAEYALAANAEVVLLHCRRSVPSEVGEPNAQMMLEHYMKAAQSVLEPHEKFLKGKGVAVRTEIVGGKPGPVITDVAKAEKADLIIMGSKGKSDLEGLILGSVTHTVLHTASCPVLVIK